MLLIFSDKNDVSTHKVVDWLSHYKKKFIRVNEDSGIQVETIVLSNGKVDFLLTIDNPLYETTHQIKASDITGYWYRRGHFNIQTPFLKNSMKELESVVMKMWAYNNHENKQIVDFFHYYFNHFHSLGCYNDNFTINKMYNLFVAQKLGIVTPESMSIRQKKDLESFISKHSKCILKGFDKNSFGIPNVIGIGNSSTLITHADIQNIPQSFNYTFIQQYIDKKADIRIFYLDRKIYSTAIFSQNDEQTRIDFRNYNSEKPNRILPFKLPKEEEKKIMKLMKILNYKTGSIDYLQSYENKFYFLEINPVGQYGFISESCNLYLDKKIVNYFLNNDRNNNFKEKC